jgi:hypothetical protein
MLDDINLMKTVLPDLHATNKMVAHLAKMNAFANTQGLLSPLNISAMGISNADQKLICSAITSQNILSDLSTSAELLSSIGATQKMLDNIGISTELASSIGTTQKILNDISVTSGLLPDFNYLQKILSSFTEAYSSTGKDMLFGLTASQLLTSLEVTSLTHLTIANLSWEKIGGAIGISNKIKSHLHSNFLGLSDSYFRLFHSFDQADILAVGITPLNFQLPAFELFNATDLLKVITTNVDDSKDKFVGSMQNARYEISAQVTDSLESLIAQLDNNLVHLWQGAIQALDSNNEDRSRHFLISLRELFAQILHKLAPDDEIYTWSNSPEHFDKGRPTRRARLLYICRSINSNSFSTFIEKDITSVLSSWEILNKAHQIVIPFTQMQLNAFKIRTESALRLLLEIWRASKTNR